MKILHVIDSGGLYGAEIMLLGLMEAQLQLGEHPLLLSIGTPGEKQKSIEIKAIEKGLPVIPVRMKAGLNPRGARGIFHRAAQEKVDLIHSHGYKGNILLGLLPLSFRSFPLIATLHGWTGTGGRINRMWLYEWLDALSLHFVDHVVFVSEAMREHHRLKTLPINNTSVINNGLSVQDMDSAKPAAIPETIFQFIRQRFTILGAGRFSPEKDFISLVRAVSGLVHDESCDLQLLLLGEGPLRKELIDEAAMLGITDRVLFPGYTQNVPVIMRCCQAFAMPSLTEGLPMALLEAMASEIPIVTSRVGGMPYALEGGKAGFLIEPGNVDMLKQALREIYVSPHRSAQLVSRAKERVLSKFSNITMAEEYQKIYQDILFQQ